MVQRRKLLIGLGAVGAGAVTAFGTGALTSSRVDRNITAEVVGDGSAYIVLRAWSQYAEVSNGQLYLHFDDETSDTDNPGPADAEGLNQDSVNTFDDVFRISANTAGAPNLKLWIEDPYDRLSFYWSSGLGAGNPNLDQPATEENGVILSTDANTNVNVGLEIDLNNVESTGEIFTDEDDVKIHAEQVA